jgi:hypothetical protein
MNNTKNKSAVSEIIEEYNKVKEGKSSPVVKNTSIPSKVVNIDEAYTASFSKETDPDLMVMYETIELPSKGLFYSNGLKELDVEYMTAKDEDLITTPSLIENGTAMPKLLKRKIKTLGVDPEDLLSGDRNAVILFLRTSSYGSDYTVEVYDPRDGKTFKQTVDLLSLNHRKTTEDPDEDGLFSFFLPIRKKKIRFKLLTHREEELLLKKAEALQIEYNEDFNSYNTMRLKASIYSIEDNTDRSYIGRFVDAMPAGDALSLRKKIMNVSPDIDLKYNFKAPDGYEFEGYLSIGVDFFFPRN